MHSQLPVPMRPLLPTFSLDTCNLTGFLHVYFNVQFPKPMDNNRQNGAANKAQFVTEFYMCESKQDLRTAQGETLPI